MHKHGQNLKNNNIILINMHSVKYDTLRRILVWSTKALSVMPFSVFCMIGYTIVSLRLIYQAYC